MAFRTPAGNSQSELQRLRTEIGRRRRHIDRRVDSLIDRSVLIGCTREFVRQHPARSVLSAAGAGMLVARLLGRRDGTQSLGRSLAQLAFEQAWPKVLAEIRQLGSARRDKGHDSDAGGSSGEEAADDES